jgi:thioredoxin-related protein
MKRLIFLLFALLASGSGTALAELPTATDLASLGQQAQRQGKPLLVFFYQEQCHYCETVRKQYLLPMSREPEAERRVILRKFDTRGEAVIRDFSGKRLPQQQFAHRERKTFTPTIALYGPNGERLTRPLVGLKGGRDYYGHYLDKTIEAAETALEDLR